MIRPIRTAPNRTADRDDEQRAYHHLPRRPSRLRLGAARAPRQGHDSGAVDGRRPRVRRSFGLSAASGGNLYDVHFSRREWIRLWQGRADLLHPRLWLPRLYFLLLALAADLALCAAREDRLAIAFRRPQI